MQHGESLSKAPEVSELNNGGCQRLCLVEFEFRAKSTENDENRPREHHIVRAIIIRLQYVRKTEVFEK